MIDGPRTICVKCKWYDRGKRKSQHWCQQLCTHPAVQREAGIDPVLGQPTFYDAGKPHCGPGHDSQAPPCITINTVGDCPYYKPTMKERVIGKMRWRD